METKGTSAPQEQFDESVTVETVIETPAVSEPATPKERKPRIAKAKPVEAAAQIEEVEPVQVEQTSPEAEQSSEPVAAIVAAIALAAQEAQEPQSEGDSQIDSELTDATEEAAAQAAQNELAVKTKAELVEMLFTMIQESPVQQLKQPIEQLKIAFYKKHNAELETLKAEFTAQNTENPEAEFIAPDDAVEQRMKELLNLYRTKRDQYIQIAEHEKQQNYKAKLAIIEELKELTSSSETLNQTFATFRELQKRWKDIGLVPQSLVRDLWETYNYHIETFYNYIKINKELRDLDLKKNYEAKMELCDAAEALVLETSPVTAFHKLQKLHNAWREVGPVAQQYKEQLWERFKQASSHINKRHQEHFDSIKDEQVANLQLKEELCAKIEELAIAVYANRQQWDQASEQIIEMQKVWKTIGFAPKKDNNRIYERFRAACDKFFTAKRDFFEGLKSEFTDNYQAKLDLCVQAEALVDNTDWKQTTDDIIELQKRWKTIGPTSRKYSDAVWKRFRGACDKFFENKSKHFENADSQYTQNLQAKQQIIAELKELDMAKATFENLKEFQHRWSAIGFVPIKQKETLHKQYKELTDRLYETIRGGEPARRVENFKGRVSHLKESGRASTERDKLIHKMHSLESEIGTLENNIGFFGTSKNAEALVREVQNKIDRAKAEITEIIEKIKIIDNQ